MNKGDYDKRTALHLAASEGLLPAVRFLIEDAKADTAPVDRWGFTPLDDAVRGKHRNVVDFLTMYLPTASPGMAARPKNGGSATGTWLPPIEDAPRADEQGAEDGEPISEGSANATNDDGERSNGPIARVGA